MPHFLTTITRGFSPVFPHIIGDMERYDRTILHVDCDAFYASVECLYYPELSGIQWPLWVTQNCAMVLLLAKSYEAKRFGVQTGDPIWLARQKCSDIELVPAHFDRYLRHFRLTKEIFTEYSAI